MERISREAHSSLRSKSPHAITNRGSNFHKRSIMRGRFSRTRDMEERNESQSRIQIRHQSDEHDDGPHDQDDGCREHVHRIDQTSSSEKAPRTEDRGDRCQTRCAARPQKTHLIFPSGPARPCRTSGPGCISSSAAPAWSIRLRIFPCGSLPDALAGLG